MLQLLWKEIVNTLTFCAYRWYICILRLYVIVYYNSWVYNIYYLEIEFITSLLQDMLRLKNRVDNDIIFFFLKYRLFYLVINYKIKEWGKIDKICYLDI